MDNKTNFDEIRRVALKLADMEGIPELTKDFLISLVASETSLVNYMQGFATLSILSPTFGEVVERTMENAMKNYLLMVIENKLGGKR